ncbi:Alpha-dioxygenase 1 [Acorus gramineus]|uniref:Alpha-dioxygenase 1 n=1 Tax=Acorus gramineus TaxID=55184 RepID=A0AAV9AUW3_ACOGR|nr:Alpha-dioxygenase 1 [Acorus gramineus]
MIHDWIDHLEETNQLVRGDAHRYLSINQVIYIFHDSLIYNFFFIQTEIVAPPEVASQCPLKSFRFYKTKEVPTGFYDIKTGSLNIRTPWWDGSAIYGSDANKNAEVRTFKDGKLKIADNGLLQHGQDGIAISGDVRNSWAGVSTLQALFIKEHNAVCDAIKHGNPFLGDVELYRYARLVTAAVIAKIHTIDWTVELLKTDTLYAAMHANWYGLLGKKFKDAFGHVGSEILSGYVGMKKPENHGVPYSLTEDFTSVYRMHPLLPDTLHLRDTHAKPGKDKSPPMKQEYVFQYMLNFLYRTFSYTIISYCNVSFVYICIGSRVPMIDLIGLKGEKTLTDIGFTGQLVSMGHQASGALEMWNYPKWLRDIIAQNPDGSERPDHVDMPALESELISYPDLSILINLQ